MNATERPLRVLSKAVATGAIRCETIIEEAVARHEKHGETIGAYRYWDAERARRCATAIDSMLRAGMPCGSLAGIPVSVKDVIGVRGMPIFAGMAAQLDARWQAEGPIVSGAIRDSAVVVGKTHTAELAFSGVGTCEHWKAPRNPWSSHQYRLCGGSSVGAGVSILEGSALLAFGTDTGGSVRLPASVSGVVGLKTTAGRWSTDGVVPLSKNFDTIGLLARTVDDVAFAFSSIDPELRSGRTKDVELDIEISSLRIGICDDHFWNDCDPEIAERVRDALRELEKKGATIKRVAFPEASEAQPLYASIVPVEGLTFLKEYHEDRIEKLDSNIRARMMLACDVSATQYFYALKRVRDLAHGAPARLRDIDVLVTPATPLPPPTIEEVGDEINFRNYNSRCAPYLMPISLLGLCALTMPVALDSRGMPIGMQLVTPGFTEDRLLAASMAVERALGNCRQRLGSPPLLS